MTDRYENIRKALEMGPTPESWAQDIDGDAAYAMFCCQSAKEATFITACDPDPIRSLLDECDVLAAEVKRLLAENERLRAEVERFRTDGASAVRRAPGSAYWSEVLKELFGPDARKGIDILERRWQAELERADKLAEALGEIRHISNTALCKNSND